MDKYEYRTKAEQIVKYVGKKKYAQAMEIADKIDWNRVKNVQMLCTVSDVYEKTGKLEESREILYLAYDRSPADRIIIYKIVELSLAIGDLKEAVNYFREYTTLSPNDSNIYILKYKLYVANNSNVETLISILEEFKEQEFHEEWGLELARLYAKGGYVDQCVEMCDELDLWFNEGPYVLQALELKSQFEELTQSQREKLEQGHAAMDEAAQMEKMFSYEENYDENYDEEESAEEEADSDNPFEEEEDMFFAGNRSNSSEYSDEGTNASYEDEADSSEEGSYEEIYGESESEDDEDEQINESDKGNSGKRSNGKNRSGGVLNKLSKLGKMLVEPSSDYDFDDEEPYEDIVSVHKDDVDDNMQYSKETEYGEEEPYMKVNEYEEAQYSQEDEYEGPQYFGGEEYEEEEQYSQVNEFEGEEQYTQPPEFEEEPNKLFRNEKKKFSLGDVAASQEVYEEQSDKKETQEKSIKDTKDFDRKTFRVSREQYLSYEKKMDGALRNIDKVVKGRMNSNNLKEEVASDNLTPVWNGVSRYDTMNLQKELARSIQKLLEATEKDDVDSTLEDVKRLVEDSNIPELTATMRFKTIRAAMLDDWARNQVAKLNNKPEIEQYVKYKLDNYVEEEPQEVEPQPVRNAKRADVEVIQSIKLKPTKEDRKRELEQILVQENDGQIGIIMPEKEAIEKQITGQLNIEDILNEWNRQKNDEKTEKEKKELEKARNKALNETQEFMSQVIDVLNQCLPKSGEGDAGSYTLHNQLAKIQKELNSTSDLSEISKLNFELARILDKICPTPTQDEELKDIAVSKEEPVEQEIEDKSDIIAVEEAVEQEKEEDSDIESLEETAGQEKEDLDTEAFEEAVEQEEEEDSDTEVFEETAEQEKEEDIDIEALEEAAEQEKEEDSDTESLEDNIEKRIDEKFNEDQDADEVNEVVQEPIDESDDISRMLKEALYDIAHEVQTKNDMPDTKSLKESAASLSAIMPEMSNNNLTNKQREALSYFASFENVVLQVDKLLNIDKKGTENMVITGPDASGKTSLAIRIIKAQQDDDTNDKVVAKIKGASLNSQDLDVVFDKVKDGVLVIEKAAALSDNTMKNLGIFMDWDGAPQVILVTKKKSIARLRGRNPEFMQRFKVYIDLPSYSNDELVEYGKAYAKAKEYEIEDMAVLALFSRIGSLQSTKGAPNFDDVKSIIDEAIENSEKRRKKIIKRLFGKKNEETAAYLLEDDFRRK